MCGISGIFDRSGKTPKDSSIKLMNSFMDKRGPDHEAVYTSEYIGLGHRRLSIIDLSQNAMQPMASEEYGTMILFNGEIYNHSDLRKRLENKNIIFKTSHSDTELLLLGLSEFGLRF